MVSQSHAFTHIPQCPQLSMNRCQRTATMATACGDPPLLSPRSTDAQAAPCRGECPPILGVFETPATGPAASVKRPLSISQTGQGPLQYDVQSYAACPPQEIPNKNGLHVKQIAPAAGRQISPSNFAPAPASTHPAGTEPIHNEAFPAHCNVLFFL